MARVMKTVKMRNRRFEWEAYAKAVAGSDLYNWTCDSGATACMTPFIADFMPYSITAVEKTIEVADGFNLPCDKMGSVSIEMRRAHSRTRECALCSWTDPETSVDHVADFFWSLSIVGWKLCNDLLGRKRR